jgi:diguanylate cyclase (GGDEF)-like protein/PAS domain S-box-containing protein
MEERWLSEVDRRLEEERRRLKQIVDTSLDVAIIATDANGTITLFNAGAEALLGYAAAEVVGVATPELFHLSSEIEERAHVLSQHLGRRVSGFQVFAANARHQTETRQWTYVRKDGTHRKVRLSVSTLEGQEGEVVGHVGIAIDVTPILEAMERARIASQQFQGAFAAAAHGMALVSLEGRWMEVNDAVCRMLGYYADELLDLDFQTLTHPEDLDGDLELLREVLRGDRLNYQIDKRYLHRDGGIVWGRLSVSLVRDDLEQPAFFVAQIQDITGLVLADRKLRDSEEFLRTTLDAIGEPVLTLSATGVVSYANIAAISRLAVPDRAALVGGRLDDVVTLRSAAAPESPLDLALLMSGSETDPGVPDDLMLHVKGRQTPISITKTLLPASEGVPQGSVIVLHDVSAERSRAVAAQALALTDPLTGLANRRAFDERLSDVVARGSRHDQSATLVVLDLDAFKPINDTFGHLAGDAYLRAIAHVLRANVRDTDLVARLGGDEFAIVLRECSLTEGTRIASTIRDAIAALTVPWESHTLRAGASIGVAPVDRERGAQATIEAADAACYTAKAAGKGKVRTAGEAALSHSVEGASDG